MKERKPKPGSSALQLKLAHLEFWMALAQLATGTWLMYIIGTWQPYSLHGKIALLSFCVSACVPIGLQIISTVAAKGKNWFLLCVAFLTLLFNPLWMTGVILILAFVALIQNAETIASARALRETDAD